MGRVYHKNNAVLAQTEMHLLELREDKSASSFLLAGIERQRLFNN